MNFEQAVSILLVVGRGNVAIDSLAYDIYGPSVTEEARRVVVARALTSQTKAAA